MADAARPPRSATSHALTLLVALLVAGSAAGEVARDGREVVTLTEDADGRPRSRRAWFAHVDGALFVRTTPLATWGANALREGFLGLLVNGHAERYRVQRIEDPALVQRVDEAFRAKYGTRDAWADLMRALWGGKIALRLEPAGAGETGDTHLD